MKKTILTLLMSMAFNYLYCANIKDMTKIIRINLRGNSTPDKVALIDKSDYQLIKNHNWYSLSGRYVYTKIKDKTVLMHRMITNAPDDYQVDHKNRNGFDNRRTNLRLCTRGENQANRVKRKSPTSSKYKGVCYRATHKIKKRWRCVVAEVEIGVFLTEELAARAYDQKVKELYGDFAMLNFPIAEQKIKV